MNGTWQLAFQALQRRIGLCLRFVIVYARLGGGMQGRLRLLLLRLRYLQARVQGGQSLRTFALVEACAHQLQVLALVVVPRPHEQQALFARIELIEQCLVRRLVHVIA